MSSLAFWKAVVADRSNFLERIFEVLKNEGFGYCVIGGVGINAYVAPVVTEDLDIVLGLEDLPRAVGVLGSEFRVEEFEHSINVYDPGSRLQVQIQKDPVLSEIIDRAEAHEVMGFAMPVAAPEDLIRLKSAAASDPTRRQSKRLKDLADIARLLETYPELREFVPEHILQRIFE